MMTVSLREAHPSQHRISLAAVRSSLLLMLLALFGGSAFAQGLSPGGAIHFGVVNLGSTGPYPQQFTGPTDGTPVSIQNITAVTEGAPGKDFTVVSSTCTGTITYPNTCTVDLTFTPTKIGLRLGALLVTNNAGVVVNTIYLSGVGVGPQFAFAPATAVITDSATTLSPASFTAGAAVKDGLGDTFFTDVEHGRILERSATGVYSPVVDLPVSNTSGIAIDGAGNLYVSSGSSVYTIPLGVTPYAAAPLIISNVTLSKPTGLAVDPSGDLYIADSTNNKIYQLPPGTTSANTLAFTGPGASLSGPTGLAVDSTSNIYPDSNLYIADTNNNHILENSLGSTTTTDVSPTSITLSKPTGVAVDAAGTLYIADTGHSQVVEATIQNGQFVLTETPALTLTTPAGVLILNNGDLVISDTTLGLVFISRSTPALNYPTSFPTPTLVGSPDSTDDPSTFLTVQETGNIASTLTAAPDPSFGGPESAAFLLGSSVSPTNPACPALGNGASPTNADTFSIGEICAYNVNFDPTIVGLNTATLVFTTTTAAAGVPSSSNTASLSGMGITTLTHFSLVAISTLSNNPTTVNLGGSVELVLTALNSDNTVATDYVGTITFTTTDTNGLYKGGTGANTNTTTYTMTAADNGVLTIPVASGLQLNQYGVWTAKAVADPASVPTGANGTAVSNNIYVVEPSTLSLTSSVNPSLVNQTTVFTLTISTTGTIPPGGTVSFYNGTTLIGTETITDTSLTTGTASISDSFSATGSYPITAVYTSTSNTQGGTASLTQIVGYATTATLTSSVNPVAVNANTTLTATIKSTTGTPTGIVTFKSNGIAIGTGTLSGGVATLVTSFNLPGVYTLVAVYAGNANNQGATTNTVLETVLNVANISLISSVNPVFLDNPTILTATITTAAAGTTAAGTISFFDGSTPIGTGTIVNGTVSVTASFVYAGTHTLTAVYSGNATLAAATSPAYAQTVADFSLAVATGGSATGSAIAGGTVTYPLVVTPIITSTLPGPITLTFSGLPASVTGTLTPATIATGSGATPVAFAVTAANLPLTSQLHPSSTPSSTHSPAHRSPLGYAPITLALVALPLAWFRRRKRFASLFASICLLFAITAGLSGCVSAPNTGYYGQTPQTYNLTVTATSGNLSRSTYLTLTVQ
jgi:sugar lactone lactonase YvrE